MVKPHARRVVLVGPAPQYVTALPRVLANSGGDAQVLRKALVDKLFTLDEQMRTLAGAADVPYLSLMQTLCQGKLCQAFAEPDVPMQYDYGHFTVEGSVEAIKGLKLDRVLAPAS